MKALKGYIKHIVLYLVFFLQAYGIAIMMVTQNENEIFESPGFIIMLASMFAFWIILAGVKWFYYYDEMEVPSTDVTRLLGLISSALTVIVQIYIRFRFGFTSFFGFFFGEASFEYYYADPEFSTCYIILYLLAGVVGYTFFTQFTDRIGGMVVEVTKYYDNSGYLTDTKVSDPFVPISGCILIGYLTAIIPLFVCAGWLVLLPLGYYIFSYFPHESEEKAKKHGILLAVGLLILASIPTVIFGRLDYELNKSKDGFVVTGDGPAGIFNHITGTVYIPDTYAGLPVTAVAENAFGNHYLVRRLIIKGDMEFSKRAFYSMTNLKRLDLYRSVTGDSYSTLRNAFNTVTWNGGTPTYHSISMEEIHIYGERITMPALGYFDLSDVYIHGELGSFAPSFDEGTRLFLDNGVDSLLKAETIEGYSCSFELYCRKGLGYVPCENITTSARITSVKNLAGVTNLKSLTIGEKVSFIQALYGCTSLEAVNLPTGQSFSLEDATISSESPETAAVILKTNPGGKRYYECIFTRVAK